MALALQAPAVRKAIELRATGSTVKGIAYKRLKFVQIPIPPVVEQAEIVKRVNSLMGVADTIQQRLEAAATRIDRLPQAILAKAFSGELVPTEAELARAEGRDYESAEELLARVVEYASPSTRKNGKGREMRQSSASFATDE